MIRRLPTLCHDVTPGPRKDVLYFLSCFHGLLSLLREDPEFYQKACQFLKELVWTQEEIDDAFQRLERHLTNPLSVKEQVVHDANYAELLGAFGIAKAFTKGGAEGQSFEETADIFEHQYLDKIEFRTPAGKRLSDEGRQYVKEFLSCLRDELSCMG